MMSVQSKISETPSRELVMSYAANGRSISQLSEEMSSGSASISTTQDSLVSATSSTIKDRSCLRRSWNLITSVFFWKQLSSPIDVIKPSMSESESASAIASEGRESTMNRSCLRRSWNLITSVFFWKQLSSPIDVIKPSMSESESASAIASEGRESTMKGMSTSHVENQLHLLHLTPLPELVESPPFPVTAPSIVASEPDKININESHPLPELVESPSFPVTAPSIVASEPDKININESHPSPNEVRAIGWMSFSEIEEIADTTTKYSITVSDDKININESDRSLDDGRKIPIRCMSIFEVEQLLSDTTPEYPIVVSEPDMIDINESDRSLDEKD